MVNPAENSGSGNQEEQRMQQMRHLHNNGRFVDEDGILWVNPAENSVFGNQELCDMINQTIAMEERRVRAQVNGHVRVDNTPIEEIETDYPFVIGCESDEDTVALHGGLANLIAKQDNKYIPTESEQASLFIRKYKESHELVREAIADYGNAVPGLLMVALKDPSQRVRKAAANNKNTTNEMRSLAQVDTDGNDYIPTLLKGDDMNVKMPTEPRGEETDNDCDDDCDCDCCDNFDACHNNDKEDGVPEPGDVVVLISGGPRMTIAAIDGETALCVWFDIVKCHNDEGREIGLPLGAHHEEEFSLSTLTSGY